MLKGGRRTQKKIPFILNPRIRFWCLEPWKKMAQNSNSICFLPLSYSFLNFQFDQNRKFLCDIDTTQELLIITLFFCQYRLRLIRTIVCPSSILSLSRSFHVPQRVAHRIVNAQWCTPYNVNMYSVDLDTEYTVSLVNMTVADIYHQKPLFFLERISFRLMEHEHSIIKQILRVALFCYIYIFFLFRFSPVLRIPHWFDWCLTMK